MITVIDYDLSTRDGWRTYVDACFGRIAQDAKERGDGHELTHVILTVTRDPFTNDPPWPAAKQIWLATAFPGHDDDDDGLKLEEDKEDFARLVMLVATAGQAVGNVTLSEAWMSQADPDPKAPYVRPSRDPARKEIAICCALHVDFGSSFLHAEILRDGKKRRTGLGPVERDDDFKGGARWGYLMPAQLLADPSFPLIRRAAQLALEERKKRGAFEMFIPKTGATS